MVYLPKMEGTKKEGRLEFGHLERAGVVCFER